MLVGLPCIGLEIMVLTVKSAAKATQARQGYTGLHRATQGYKGYTGQAVKTISLAYSAQKLS